MKTCNKCGREYKNESDAFYKDKTKKDGFSTICKACRSEYGKERYDKVIKPMLPQIYEERRKRRATDEDYAERTKEYRRKTHRKHREKDNEKNRERYRNNKETVNRKQKEWYEKNKEKHLADGHKWIEKNREEFNKRRREKRNSDELLHFKETIRGSIQKCFVRKNHKKNTNTEKIIGCTFEEARDHLEQTWLDNYGKPYNGEKVHIDHIIPLSTAKTKEDVIRLCHISNLQYLKPSDNMSKQDRLDWCVKSKKSVV